MMTIKCEKGKTKNAAIPAQQSPGPCGMIALA